MGISLYQAVVSSPRIRVGFVVIILIVAWSGYLDRLGEQLTGSAITQAGIIYATARGINALVSMLQTTTISPVIASVSIGELLDPINDMIERFSTVMTWSIASLVLQKILAGIVSKTIFQVLLSIVAALAIVGMFVKRNRVLNKFWHIFLLVVFVRFSIAAMLILNSWADQMFLQTYIKENHQELVGFKNDASLYQQLVTDVEIGDENDRVSGPIVLLKDELTQLREAKKQMDDLLETRERELSELNDVAGRWWWDKVLGAGATQEIQDKTDAISRTEAVIDEIDHSLASRTDALKCLEKQEEGEACGWSIWLPSFEMPSISLFGDLKKKFTSVSQNLFVLLAALLLRCLIFPLLFLLLFWRAFKRVANSKS